MTGEQDAQSRRNGQQAAWRMTFGQVLELLDDPQAERLLARVTADLASLRGLWMERPPSGFREDLLRQLEEIQVVLRERTKVSQREAAPYPYLELFCSRCDATVPFDGTPIDKLACPFCGRGDWLFPRQRP